MQISQSTHRQSFIDILANDIRKTASDENLSFHAAATRVLLGWLGYNLEDVNFIDVHDRGIDAWLPTESGIDIFQFKTHEPNAIGALDLRSFNGEGIRDLERAKIFLLQERASNVSNKKLKQLLHEWDSAIRNHRLENSPIAMSVTLYLIVLGDNLTEAAQSEFQSFQLSNSSIQFVDDIPVQFHSVFHTINHIIDCRWREENRSWTDLKGRKHERIMLHPWNDGDSISDNANAVFYCLAIDLVKAYDALGYQLFEPNVRANIKNSRVNQAIKESILHQRTRREFRFLNNGVTITCDAFTKPRLHQPFTVTHPGIVNGLQTVVALHTAYQLLSDQDKGDFEKNCSVLVRLLTNNAVDDITRVVKATNNQNPRTTRSNRRNNKSKNMVSSTIQGVIMRRT